MDREAKKSAIAAYKERKENAGIFAVRCTTSGEVWVGRTADLNAIQNRIWFTLRLGSGSNADMRKAWLAHGPESFAFEILQALEPEEVPYLRDAALKERMTHWQRTLGARAV